MAYNGDSILVRVHIPKTSNGPVNGNKMQLTVQILCKFCGGAYVPWITFRSPVNVSDVYGMFNLNGTLKTCSAARHASALDLTI